MPQFLRKQFTTTSQLNSKKKSTKPCGSAALTRKKREFGSGQTAVFGTLSNGIKASQIINVRQSIVWSSSGIMAEGGTTMTALQGTTFCAAGSFARQVELLPPELVQYVNMIF